MTWLLSKIGGALWPVIAIAAAVLLLALGVQTYRITILKAHAAELEKVQALKEARRAQEALELSGKYRALELEMQAQAEKAERTYHAAQSRNDSALAAARVDTGKLRNQLASYAANAGSTTPDTVAASNQRAAALAGLLAEALRADAESAAEAESNGDGVRALLAAWPHEDVAISLPKMRLGQ